MIFKRKLTPNSDPALMNDYELSLLVFIFTGSAASAFFSYSQLQRHQVSGTTPDPATKQLFLWLICINTAASIIALGGAVTLFVSKSALREPSFRLRLGVLIVSHTSYFLLTLTTTSYV
jgi:hypothetical protein